MIKKILPIALGVIIMVLAVLLGTYMVMRKQQGKSEAAKRGPSLTLTTPNTKVKVGDSVTVLVSIDSKGFMLSGADLKINYDPSILTARSITATGGLLPTVLIPGQIEDTVGQASLVTICIPGGASVCPVQGAGNLAEITFDVKGPGRSKISFNKGTIISASGYTTNVVGQLRSIQISASNR